MRNFGFILLGIGIAILLLGSNYYLDFDISFALHYLWPLIIVAIGLEMVSDNHKYMKYFYFLFLVLFIAFAVFGVSVFNYINPIESSYLEASADRVMKNYSSYDYKKAKLEIDEIGSHYKIESADIDGISSDSEVNIEEKVKNKYIKYQIESLDSNENEEWLELKLSNFQEWDIEINSFEINLVLDARNLLLNKLKLSGLNCSSELKLSEKNHGKIDIEGTDVSLNLLLEGNVGYRIEGDAMNVEINGQDYNLNKEAYENSFYKENGGVIIKVDALNVEISSKNSKE